MGYYILGMFAFGVHIKKYGLAAFMLLVLVSCVYFEPNNDLTDDADLPPTFSLFDTHLSRSEPRLSPWWHTFDSRQLNQLIETAMGDNFTLQQAWARLHQARARSVIQNAERYPDLSAGLEADFGRRRNKNGTDETRRVENVAIGLVSNYEIDLWGRVRAAGEAARLNETAGWADLQTAAMTLSAEITQRWVNNISLRLQKALLQKQLETNRVRLELVELRYRNGLASSVNVFQQRELVARVKRQMPLVDTQEAINLNQLALLLGNPNVTMPSIEATTLPRLKSIPEPGLPADLLANRPDVRAVGMRLQAARWQRAAARAARLPAIRLTGTARYGAAELDLLFSNWLINLGASLAAPIFDAGGRAAEVDRAQAVIDEQLALYRQTVYTAFIEVENAIVTERNLHRSLAALEIEIDNAKKALTEATNRYRKGLGDYLPVLTQLVNVQNLEQTQIQRREEMVLARIGLHRALGGSWLNTLLAETGKANHSTPISEDQSE